jgi:MFS family permease
MSGATRVRGTYLLLTLLATLAQSMIWGVNTLFLLDAGLTNTQAFAANAVFSLGQLVFEVPTGVVADTRGRRMSYLLGSATLLGATLLYLYLWSVGAPFIAWALVSALLGLGFTFFSGAVEAWLVDALTAHGYAGSLDRVFGQGQAAYGVAMFIGAIAGGFIAEAGTLGTPYVVRSVLLALLIVVAAVLMRDEGFSPDRSTSAGRAARTILRASAQHGWRNRPVRWLMLTAPAMSGMIWYVFYAMQPYLLELYGDSEAYGVAGIVSAVVAGTQIIGGLAVPLVRRLVRLRTTLLLTVVAFGALAMVVIGLGRSVWVVVGGFVLWALTYSLGTPVRQGFMNACLPSAQRATILSFDALLGSAGGTVTQPVLGRVADVGGYGPSYLVAAVFQLTAVPFLWLARREHSPGDLTAPRDMGGA